MTVASRSLHPTTALSVNLNKVALVRNTRHLGIPSVTRAAALCLQAGARGITVHPRPDERHVRAHDVRELAELLKQWPDREYNIEGNPFHNLMGFVREVRPHQVTFVPDSEGQFTSDHGWRFPADAERLRRAVNRVCEFIHCRLRWSAAMRRATGSFAANRQQFQRHAGALGIHRSWLFPGNSPNPETTQMRGSPVIQG